MLKFFHLAKNASPFISVGCMNLLMLMGILSGILWGLPLQVKLTFKSGCAVKSARHSILTICWNWAPASTVESTLFTWELSEEVNSGDSVTIGWKFWKKITLLENTANKSTQVTGSFLPLEYRVIHIHWPVFNDTLILIQLIQEKVVHFFRKPWILAVESNYEKESKYVMGGSRQVLVNLVGFCFLHGNLITCLS